MGEIWENGKGRREDRRDDRKVYPPPRVSKSPYPPGSRAPGRGLKSRGNLRTSCPPFASMDAGSQAASSDYSCSRGHSPSLAIPADHTPHSHATDAWAWPTMKINENQHSMAHLPATTVASSEDSALRHSEESKIRHPTLGAGNQSVKSGVNSKLTKPYTSAAQGDLPGPDGGSPSGSNQLGPVSASST